MPRDAGQQSGYPGIPSPRPGQCRSPVSDLKDKDPIRYGVGRTQPGCRRLHKRRLAAVSLWSNRALA